MLSFFCFHYLTGFLEYPFQYGLFFNGKEFSTRLLNLLVQNVHPVQCLGSRGAIYLGTKLMFLVESALFGSLLLQIIQLVKPFFEDSQCVLLSGI